MNSGGSGLRVALACEFPSINGGERSLLAVCDALRGQTVEFLPLLSTTEGRFADEFRARGLEPQSVPWANSSGEAQGVLSSLLEDWKADLLHANSLTLARRIGDLAAQLPCPVTGHVRDIMRLSGSAIGSLNRLRGLVAVSEATREVLIEQGVSPSRVSTIHNGISLEQFSPQPATGWLHRELGIAGDTPLVAIIGQICLRKGHAEFAEAAVRLRSLEPPPHFLIIGERHSRKQESVEFEAACLQTFADAGMSERVHQLGFREDVVRIFPELRLLMHPARQEPFGRVLLEAAACGVPIVATDVGGTRELLSHQGSAWLVPPRQPQLLAEAARLLLEDDALSRQLGVSARVAAKRFSISEAADRLLAFWREMRCSA